MALETATRTYGGQSMTAPLREALLKSPDAAFARAFDDPAHGFLHACDLDVARREHAAFADLLASLGVSVNLRGCNVLAVRPGVAVLADGNPKVAAALAAHDVEVHTYAATEIGMNGSGGPTCLTRPILRA